MRVLQLLHRISLRCSPGSCLLRSLFGPDQRRRLQIRNNPTGSSSARMSTRIKEGETFGTPSRATGLVKELTSQPLGVANVSSKSVPDVSAEKVLARGSILTPRPPPPPGLISSFCCGGASSFSSGSSRTASPGPPAGPDRPEPSSPACGAWWTS